MIYHTLEELGNNTLSCGDIVYFYVNNRHLKYSVQSDHLCNMFRCDNAEIFSILGIKKDDFCRWHYGYEHNGGDWPSCKVGDFAALTRAVKVLYLEIERKKEREVSTLYLENKNLIQKLKTNLSTILSNPLLTAPLVLEKKEDTSSNILVKRKSKVKRIVGEESIKLNNY